MIFVAKKADYSAGNIGVVSIKNINDVDKSTFELISRLGGKYSIGTDDEKIIALDTFLSVLNSASWKSKIVNLVIPIAGKEETITNETAPELSNIVSSDIGIQLSSLTERQNVYNTDKGLTAEYLIEGTAYRALYVSKYGELTNRNVHCLTYGVGDRCWGSSDDTTIMIRESFVGFTKIGKQEITGNNNLAKLLGVSMTSSGTSLYVDDSKIGTINTDYSVSTAGATMVNQTLFSTKPKKGDSYIAFASYGYSFTESELAEYVKAINNLMGVLYPTSV